MKTNNYLWTALAAATLTLAGCGGDDNGMTEPRPQENIAQLELHLTGNKYQSDRQRIARAGRGKHRETFHRRHLQQ